MKTQKSGNGEQVTRRVGETPYGSDKGVVMVVVLVVSAVALVVMTALIYMVTAGTIASGKYKRYSTALEAAKGGADICYDVIGTRGVVSDMNSLSGTLGTYSMTFSSPTPSTCTSTYPVGGTTVYTGLATKLLTPSSVWQGCDASATIDPNTPTTYDISIDFGQLSSYKVYCKIIEATIGNTGGRSPWWTLGVVSSNTGQAPPPIHPSMYGIEALALNFSKPDERVRLSVLYQY